MSTPPLWIFLTYLAALQHIQLVLDDRILVACLGGLTSILGFAFGGAAVDWVVKKVFHRP